MTLQEQHDLIAGVSELRADVRNLLELVRSGFASADRAREELSKRIEELRGDFSEQIPQMRMQHVELKRTVLDLEDRVQGHGRQIAELQGFRDGIESERARWTWLRRNLIWLGGAVVAIATFMGTLIAVAEGWLRIFGPTNR